MRIEELEDLVMEFKQQQSPAEYIDLKGILLNKEQENQRLLLKVEELKKQRVAAKNLFEQNELYATFQKAIEERNEEIFKLKREINSYKSNTLISKFQEPSIPAKAIEAHNNVGKLGFNTYTTGWANERENWLV